MAFGTMGSCHSLKAYFISRIAHIVERGSDEQMAGINAGWIVAMM
jgi:hypothetical protein